ncbi:type II toxin-antitoxin system Phd/YefM family antitoxin [Glutamicibacter sp. NPDC087344]|uniref:type II toxin-antitoxin system Phd/YefM family antitoxin n=1 Tax=Glutamicibacter sp. NPDC087344 TaxID=3363994 RepID=UPI003801C30B
MLNFSYEEALQNFPHLLDNVATDHQVITVQGANHESVVLIAKDDFDSLSGSLQAPSLAASPPGADNNLDGWL